MLLLLLLLLSPLATEPFASPFPNDTKQHRLVKKLPLLIIIGELLQLP